MPRAALGALLCLAFVACGDKPGAFPLDKLTGELKSEKPDVRENAAKELGAAKGDDARRAVTMLMSTLKDSNRRVREAAAHALATIGKPALAELPDLIDIVGNESEDPRVRAGIAEALGAARGADAKRVVPVLVAVMKDPDRWVREAAVLSLGKVGSPAEAAIPALIEALHDEDDYVRYRAAAALAYLGPVAKDAIPRLEEMARDDPTEIGAYWSKEALRRIRGEPQPSH
jgi:HEAT repeat protein